MFLLLVLPLHYPHVLDAPATTTTNIAQPNLPSFGHPLNLALSIFFRSPPSFPPTPLPRSLPPSLLPRVRFNRNNDDDDTEKNSDLMKSIDSASLSGNDNSSNSAGTNGTGAEGNVDGNGSGGNDTAPNATDHVKRKFLKNPLRNLLPMVESMGNDLHGEARSGCQWLIEQRCVPRRQVRVPIVKLLVS